MSSKQHKQLHECLFCVCLSNNNTFTQYILQEGKTAKLLVILESLGKRVGKIQSSDRQRTKINFYKSEFAVKKKEIKKKLKILNFIGGKN